MPAAPPTDPLLGVVDAAEYLGITERHLRRLIAERRIVSTKIGKLVKFRRSWLDSYVSDNTREAVRTG